MLTRRLGALVKAGLMERHRYSERPPRYEYVLTERGREFRSVIVAMYAWGNKHFAPEGASVLLVNAKTGAVADPVMVDRTTGRALTSAEYMYTAGPAASERTRRKYANGASRIQTDTPQSSGVGTARARKARS